MKKEFKAWAIDTRSNEGHGFIGRYWWFSPAYSRSIPVHMKGCRIALFETRQEARDNLVHVKGGFPKARVVRVTISVDGGDS